METKKEVWKDIEGYEGIYEISNFGRVKSYKRNSEGKILKPCVSSWGYLFFVSSKGGKTKTLYIHGLVAKHFLGYKPDRMFSVVNHIDGNKTNNNISNLEIVSARKNANEFHRLNSEKLTSKYAGVSLNRSRTEKKWRASVTIKGKQIFNKHFTTELEAAAAYQSKLIELGLN